MDSLCSGLYFLSRSKTQSMVEGCEEMSLTIWRYALKSSDYFEMSRREPDLKVLSNRGSKQLYFMISLKRTSLRGTSQSRKLAMMLITLSVSWDIFFLVSSQSLADHFELLWLSDPYPVPFFFLFLSSLLTFARVVGSPWVWIVSSSSYSLSTRDASLVICDSFSKITSTKSL